MDSTAPAADARDARHTYEQMAPLYDVLTDHHDYELWLANLLPAVTRLGLAGRRLLDVGCGTGKSFLPLIDAGWEITGCDISEAMLGEASRKAGDKVRLEVADMRSLPVFGSFDLIWSLGDAINYLLEPDELVSCFAGVRRNLAPAGLFLFDVNTLHAYRTFYAEPYVYEADGRRFLWRGLATATTPAGAEVEGRLEPLDEDGEGAQESLAVHRQRHFRPVEIRRALREAGLVCRETFGHHYDARLEQPLDEGRHTKAVFIAGHSTRDEMGR